MNVPVSVPGSAESTAKVRSPRISVITVCFNAGATLESAITSVLGQDDVDVEYIVVDGASTDGTRSIVDRYRDRIAVAISEPDHGIFDAMNKGLDLATGDVIYFLNADDEFVDAHVARDVAREFAEDDRRLLIYGRVLFRDAPPDAAYLPRPFRSWTTREFLHNAFCHQAIFARRALFEVVGNFDLRSQLSADYEWVIKAFRARPRGFHFFDRDIAHYYFRGRSFQQADAVRREVRANWYRHLPLSPSLLWFDFRYVLLRGWKKRLLGER